MQTDEVDKLMGLFGLVVEQGDGFDEGIRLALKAVLVSHHFAYRVELDADPESPEEHPLTDWELASRLSYFLWSSMPDEELMELAEAGQLNNHEEIEKQVRRMLASPKATALVDNFAGQWLYTRALDDASPDIWYFEDGATSFARQWPRPGSPSTRSCARPEPPRPGRWSPAS